MREVGSGRTGRFRPLFCPSATTLTLPRSVRLALEVLRARVGSPDPLSPTTSALSSYFAESSSFPFNSRARSTTDLVSDYTASLDAQAQQRGISTSKLVEEMDAREREEKIGEAELESLEVVLGRGNKRVSGRRGGVGWEGREKGGKKARGDGGEAERASEVEEESEDEVMEALDELIRGAREGS